jgi:hypothetical protein
MREEKMTPDFDLSNLENAQVEMWFFLRIDDILGQILAGQSKRLAFPAALRDCMVTALTAAPMAGVNSVKPGADRLSQLRKQN